MPAEKNKGLDAFTLHIIAMAFMLCDHIWATIATGNEWLTIVGRLAFPIFAFFNAEGFRRTKSVKRYAARLFVFALISEIPFDLMSGGTVFFPFHQNVMWTFLLSLLCMQIISLAKKSNNRVLIAVVVVLTAYAGWFVGRLTMIDYYGEGVLTVLMFYLLPGDETWQKIAQVVIMAIVHGSMLATYYYPVTISGRMYELPEQAFAVFALLLIWQYNGKRGYRNRATRWIFYAFYPAHMLILSLLMLSR